MPVEMVKFILELLLKQIILAVHHNFQWMLVATKLATFSLKYLGSQVERFLLTPSALGCFYL